MTDTCGKTTSTLDFRRHLCEFEVSICFLHQKRRETSFLRLDGSIEFPSRGISASSIPTVHPNCAAHLFTMAYSFGVRCGVIESRSLCLSSPRKLHMPPLFSIATNLEWDLNWLSASKLSLNAGSMETAWLFFELAWIKR